MIEQREYEAFRALPAVAGTVSPIRPVDVTTGHARVTLQGTGFSVRIQISNAQPGRGDQPHLFLPTDASFETFKTVTPDDPPTMIPAPVRWLRLIVDAGVITGGNVAESSRTGAEINEKLLAGMAQTEIELRQAGKIYSLGREPAAGDVAGTYRVGNEYVSWSGAVVTAREKVIPSFNVLVHERPALDGNAAANAQRLSDAAATGRIIRPFAGRYPLTSTVNLGSRAVLEMPSDTEFDITGLADRTPALYASGTLTKDVCRVTADAQAGSLTLSVDNGAALTPGDMIGIRSTEVFNPDRPLVHLKGEICVVVAVQGNTVTLLEPLRDDYAAAGYTIKVDKVVPVRGINISGGYFDAGDGKTGVRRAIGLNAFYGATINGVAGRGCRDSFAMLEYGRDITTDGNAITDADDGYGIVAYGVERWTASSNPISRVRHALDTSNNGQYPVSRDTIWTANPISYCTSAGISTHGGCDNTIITSNIVTMCGGGMALRGRRNTVKGNQVIGVTQGSRSYQHGYLFGDGGDGTGLEQPGMGLACTDLIFEGNILRGVGTAKAKIGLTSTAPLLNAHINGNDLSGFIYAGMAFNGSYIKNSEVSWNTLDCSAQAAGSPYSGIVAQSTQVAATDVTRIDGATFDNNVIINAQFAGYYLVANTDAAKASKKLRILRGRIENPRVRGVDINTGQWAGVEVAGVEMWNVPAGAEINYTPANHSIAPRISGNPVNGVISGASPVNYNADGTVTIGATTGGTTNGNLWFNKSDTNPGIYARTGTTNKAGIVFDAANGATYIRNTASDFRVQNYAASATYFQVQSYMAALTVPLRLATYTIATLPSAGTIATSSAYGIVAITDPAAGKGGVVYSDGTTIRYMSDASAVK